MLTRIVRTGLASTVSTPAIPAAWTMCVTPLRGLGQARQVEHVALHEVEVRVLAEVGARERVAVQVVERDHLVRVDEPAGERRPDEAGSAGDQDLLAAQRHAASVPRRILAGPVQRTTLLAPASLLVASRRAARRRAAPARSTCGSPTARPTTAAPQVLTLRCDPARGTVAAPGARLPPAARDRAERVRADAARHAICTQIDGGPMTALVTGSYYGRPSGRG